MPKNEPADKLNVSFSKNDDLKTVMLHSFDEIEKVLLSIEGSVTLLTDNHHLTDEEIRSLYEQMRAGSSNAKAIIQAVKDYLQQQSS